MALNNPSTLYSNENVLFDNKPYVDAYLRREAKKKAVDDAANNFFSRLPDKINAAGVRQQDLINPENPNQGIMPEIQGLRKFWQENKYEIKKGGAAQQEYMNLNQRVLRKIDQSKQRAKTSLDIGKAKFEGKFSPRENDLPVIEKINASIYSPSGYKEDGVTEYGVQDLSPSIPRFDASKQKQFASVAFGTAKPVYDESGARVDNVTGEVFIPKKYDEQSVKTIAENAAKAVQGDLSAKYHYEDLLEDPTFVANANKVFQQAYGANEVVDTPEKAAAADYLMKAQASAGEEKVKDVNYAQKLKMQMQDRGFNNALAKLKKSDEYIRGRMQKQQEYRLAIKYGVENEWLEKNYKALEDNTGETIVMTKPNGSKVEAKVMKVSSPFRKLLSVDGIEPDQVVKLPNGDVQGYFYQRYSKNDANIPKGRKAGDIVVGANGKMPIALDIKPVVLSRNDAKIAYGKTISSGKDLTGEIGDETTTEQPTSVTETTKTRSLNASQRRGQ